MYQPFSVIHTWNILIFLKEMGHLIVCPLSLPPLPPTPLPPREILIKSGVQWGGGSSAHIYEEWQCSCTLSRERGLAYVFLLWYKFWKFCRFWFVWMMWLTYWDWWFLMCLIDVIDVLMYWHWWLLMCLIDVLWLVVSDMADWCDCCIETGGFWYYWLMWLMYWDWWFLKLLINVIDVLTLVVSDGTDW